METIMRYPDKGYIIQINFNETCYSAEIQQPCGFVVRGLFGMNSKRNSVACAVNETNNLPYAYHPECNAIECANNKYLRHFK